MSETKKPTKLTRQEKERFDKSLEKWEKLSKPLEEAARRSEQITEEDLKIIVRGEGNEVSESKPDPIRQIACEIAGQQILIRVEDIERAIRLAVEATKERGQEESDELYIPTDESIIARMRDLMVKEGRKC